MEPSYFTPTEENHHCEVRGRENAKIDIFKNLYKQIYINQPLLQMIQLREKLDLINREKKNYYIFITVNPRELTKKEKKSFTSECLSIKNRSFVESEKGHGFEYRDPEKQTGYHFHGCYKLLKLYSPSHISSMFIRGVFKKYCHNIKHIHVVKTNNYKKCIEYCEKHFKKTKNKNL